MKYEVITAGNATPEKAAAILTERVNRLLGEGWETVGGASIVLNETNQGTRTFYTICQAMIKCG